MKNLQNNFFPNFHFFKSNFFCHCRLKPKKGVFLKFVYGFIGAFFPYYTYI